MLTLLSNISAIISKHLSKLQDIKPGGKLYDTALHKGADDALTSTRERIHSRGQASDGSAIGQYSTTPMYVSTATDPMGKTGKSIFANGKPHKSHYYASGYKEYKAVSGSDATTVNLTLTGEMRDSYLVIKTTDGYGLGWTNEQLTKRAAALEEKYGKKIWALTDEERAALLSTVQDGIK